MIIYANKSSLEDALKGTTTRLIVELETTKLKDPVALYTLDELEALSSSRSADALEKLVELMDTFLKTGGKRK